MLPDYPSARKTISHKLMEEVDKLASKRLGSLGRIARHRYHEPGVVKLVRADGSKDTMRPRRIEASTSPLLRGELENKPLEYVGVMMSELADSFARSQQDLILGKLSEVADAAGNTIDARGGKLSADLLLRFFDKYQIDFDPHDEPILPTMMLGHPGLAPQVEIALREIQGTPALAKRYAEIIKRQFRDWRSRQAARRLVD